MSKHLFLSRKKYGRKKKKDDSKRKHNSLSIDNRWKKLKTHFINFIIVLLNHLLEDDGVKERILKTAPNIYTEGLIEYNKILIKIKISDILSCKLSSKYKNKKQNNNIEIIKKYWKKDKFFNIFKMTFEECVGLFMILPEEYKKNYSNKFNKYLFHNLKPKVQNEIKDIIEKGISEFLDDKKPKKNNCELINLINNISTNITEEYDPVLSDNLYDLNEFNHEGSLDLGLHEFSLVEQNDSNIFFSH